ncbi:MAG: sodium:proline symporter [Thermonema sp.]|uniref:sodium:solute symporter family protein n=1 Tax=Thermonema sp. TaxID=2231181 RepID=UPI0021DD958B|nr:sodium:solute symporter family protein [Thermonema sp.]GIV40492.1 MAG: sodium:proline symporter [Thermonema sp.]
MSSALTLWDWGIIVFFLLLFVGIGVKAGKSSALNIQEYFLGGRRLPWWLAGGSMVATTFAADTPLAVTELVYKNGIAGNWLWWNAVAGGMLTVFFFAAYWHRSGVMTDAELVELRYSGKAARFLRGFRAVYLGLFMNVLIIAWVNLAMLSLLKVFFDLQDTEAFLWLAGMMVLVMFYASLSGLKGIAATDVVQFVVAMGGCIALALFVLHSESVGGMQALKSRLAEDRLSFFPAIGKAAENGHAMTIGIGSFLAFIGVQWWASWMPGAEPGGGGYIAQRLMSTRSETEAVKAGLFFQILHYALRPWPWIVVALCAVVLYPDLLARNEARYGFVYVMRDFLPEGLRGLLLVAFMAAYMSTISTQLNWGASYLTGDLYRRFLVPPSKFPSQTGLNRHYVIVSKLFTILLALAGLVLTRYIDSITAIWEFVIECGAGLGLVLILRWYWWRVNAWSEITATFVPLVVYFIAKFILVRWDPVWGMGLQDAPHGYYLTVGVTTLAWIAVTLLTPPTDNSQLKAFYEKVQPLGWWKPVSGQSGTRPLLGLLIAWALGVGLVYSLLFGIGYAVLLDFVLMAASLAIAAICGTALFFVMRRLQK